MLCNAAAIVPLFCRLLIGQRPFTLTLEITPDASEWRPCLFIVPVTGQRAPAATTTTKTTQNTHDLCLCWMPEPGAIRRKIDSTGWDVGRGAGLRKVYVNGFQRFLSVTQTSVAVHMTSHQKLLGKTTTKKDT